ncbi:M56 family metallopeptidase [Mucilaginibacter agri]|uniref:M48 family metalloprotease n=1 Tax=Mucilaginibacter agri TaxID=2695265 RepID=A0A965ZDC2_9SPHI|nr:M56 family metallopeptidase [Mucilaginibacter agri]NCD67949.1 M48 family metalloprotease [Mucilaginibacter agri]
METLLHNLSEVFAVSIIHSLWQCLIIYLVLRIFLADIVRLSSATKYNITVTALVAATGWFIYTLFDQAAHYSWQITTAHAAAGAPQHLPLIASLKEITHADERYEVTIEHYLPYISTIYIAGLLFHSLRLLSAWMQMQQLKQNTVTDQRLQKRLNELSALLKNKRAVIVSYAERIDVPCVTGYLKPIILLPLSLSTYLSAKEVEAILLHELAHVKRNDYLVNLLQQVMSVVLFFNPFVLLMNRIINQERENSCDDVVVDITGEPLVYAQALLKIEQNNVRYLPLAMAATGKKYHLLNRIERIMKTKKPMANIRHVVLAFTILIGSVSSIAWLNPAIGSGKLSVKTIKFSGIINSFADNDTTAAKKATKKSKSNLPPPPKPPKPTKVYTKNGKTYYITPGMDDPKLEAMGKQMEEYGKQLDKYYNSADFKKLSDDMAAKGKDMEAYYNNPDVKRVQAEMEKAGHDFEAAYGDDSNAKKIGQQMEAVGKKMETYYNSPEFKEMNAKLEKKYSIVHNQPYPREESERSDNYKQYQAELKKNIPADVLAYNDQMKELGKQMKDQFNNPERKAAQDRMRALGDSMRIAFNNPQIKAQQEQMRKMGEQMRNYNNNPDMKRIQKQMKDLGKQMKEYTNSPEFKKRTEEWKKSMKAMNFDYNYNFNYNTDVAPDVVVEPAPVVAPVTVTVPSVPAVKATPAPVPPVAPEKP